MTALVHVFGCRCIHLVRIVHKHFVYFYLAPPRVRMSHSTSAINHAAATIGVPLIGLIAELLIVVVDCRNSAIAVLSRVILVILSILRSRRAHYLSVMRERITLIHIVYFHHSLAAVLKLLTKINITTILDCLLSKPGRAFFRCI